MTNFDHLARSPPGSLSISHAVAVELAAPNLPTVFLF